MIPVDLSVRDNQVTSLGRVFQDNFTSTSSLGWFNAVASVRQEVII